MPEAVDSTTRRIQLFYELALATGSSLQPAEICRGFLETLLGRKPLSYGAVWIRSELMPRGTTQDVTLVYAIPRARSRSVTLRADHPLFGILGGAEQDYASVEFDDSNRELLDADLSMARGWCALFRLGGVGWLQLISNDALALSPAELGPLWTAVSQLANVLEGALAFQRGQQEVRERRLAEDRLERALAEREAIVAAAPDMLFTSDARGRLSWRSAPLGGEESMGGESGENLHDLVVPEDAAALGQWLEATTREGRCEVDVHAMVRGSKRRIHLTGIRLEQHPRESPRLVGSARDVTEREREAEELREMERQMLHSQKLESLGVLAGGVAHDFNNLLVPIVAHVDLALSTAGVPPALRDSLETIGKAARSAADLAQHMLAYSGQGKFHVRPIQLTRLVEELAKLFEVAVSKSVRLERRLDDELPLIVADESQMRQVLMNLVTNASEAIGDRPGRILLRTGSMQHDGSVLDGLVEGELAAGGYVFAEVSDTGSGMTLATLARIFDPFFSTKFTGRGLGLAAVLGIVRTHGGGIVVRSTPGEGSVFRAIFPIASDQADLGVEEVPGLFEDTRTLDARVLVVGDQEIVRRTARTILERRGLGVVEAINGKEALERIRGGESPFDLVLMDVTMPVMGGVEASLAIHAEYPDLPVILMSGFDEASVSTQSITELPFISLLKKPFRIAELMGHVRRITEPGCFHHTPK